MLIIGSHVSFKKESQLLGTVKEALNYNANTFMFYTGAPQNTVRYQINDEITNKAKKLMKENNIDINNVIVHAPYIINLANSDEEKYKFSINFLKEELKRCEKLGMTKLVLHPGSHVGLGIEKGIENITNALNEVLKETNVTILIETMAGKGTEIGRNINEIKKILENIKEKEKIGICLDTCHLSDSGINLENFKELLETYKKENLLDKIKCIHINDSKNEIGSKKDRHENIGYGTIGFDNLIDIIYEKSLENIPKILETPYIEKLPPYKEEIKMIKEKKFNNNLK